MNTILNSRISSFTSRALCPVSSAMINESSARINGGITFLLLCIFMLTQNIIPIIALALDFYLRAFNLSKLSPFVFLSGRMANLLMPEQKMINAGPKIFASRIGFVFTVMIAFAYLTNSIYAIYTLSAALGLFSLLESAFGVCVACEIYPLLHRVLNRNSFRNPASGSKTITYS